MARRKPITQLVPDIVSFVNGLGSELATVLGQELLMETRDFISTHHTRYAKGRLRSSGFLYINGKLTAQTPYDPIKVTPKGRQKINYHVAIVRPFPPIVYAPPLSGRYQLNIIFHTPRKMPPSETGKDRWKVVKETPLGIGFDYAIKVLEADGKTADAMSFYIVNKIGMRSISNITRERWLKAMS